jgi:copper transport protein
MMVAFIARVVLAFALSVAFAGTAHSHATVVETEPVDGAVLPAAPSRVRIVFNEPVSLIAAQVLDASGQNIAPPGAAVATNGSVEIALPPSMARGTYIASYRVVSVDGHPVGGSLVFSIGEATAVSRPPASDFQWRAVWIAVRAIFNAGLLGSAGACLFLLFVASSGPVAASAVQIASRVSLVGLVAAVLSIGVQGGALSGRPFSQLFGPDLWHIGFASTFGRSALIACAGMALITVGMRWPSRRILALAGAVVALASFAFAGHVVTAGPAWLTVPVILAHTSAVAFWVGSLLPLRAALKQDNAAAVVRRFSAVAVAAVAILIVAGIAIAALQVGSFSALVTTAYGWMLLGKLALVSGLLWLAALNKWWLTPALSRGDPRAAVILRRTIGAEICVAAAILVATAALGTTPPPRALLSGHAHSPDHHLAHEHHAHGLSIEMSNGARRAAVTLSSAHAGTNAAKITLTDADGSALDAKEVIFIAANFSAGVEPIQRSAVRLRPGVWTVDSLQLVPAGAWAIGVEALVSDFEKPMFEGTVEVR